MRYFLLIYDRSKGDLVEKREFDDRHQALRERFSREVRWHSRREYEVVVLGAESEEALRHTHGRYFSDVDELICEELTRS